MNHDICYANGAGLAEPRAGTVVAADARPLGDIWLHPRPRRRPVFKSGVEDDRGRAAARTVEIQPKSTRINELAGRA
jgi:hypothetical protein